MEIMEIELSKEKVKEKTIDGVVWLNRSGINELPVGIFEECVRIRLQYNHLKSIRKNTFAMCSQLDSLYLCQNNITNIEEGALARCFKLQSILFVNNKLTTLPKNLFADCPKLDNINLCGNNLTMLPDDLFTGCTQLKHVILHRNLLTLIPESVLLRLSKLKQCWLDDHLYSQVLWYIDNLDILYIFYNNKQGYPMNLIPEKYEQIMRYRRNPKDALSAFGWIIRKQIVIATATGIWLE